LIGEDAESNHTRFGGEVYAPCSKGALQAGGIPEHSTWATMEYWLRLSRLHDLPQARDRCWKGIKRRSRNKS